MQIYFVSFIHEKNKQISTRIWSTWLDAADGCKGVRQCKLM
jgi:hypothetical protein